MADVVRCDACLFWHELDEAEGALMGECRRKAPQLYEMPVDTDTEETDMTEPVAMWPQTEERDWCGDGKSVWLMNSKRYHHGPEPRKK